METPEVVKMDYYRSPRARLSPDLIDDLRDAFLGHIG